MCCSLYVKQIDLKKDGTMTLLERQLRWTACIFALHLLSGTNAPNAKGASLIKRPIKATWIATMGSNVIFAHPVESFSHWQRIEIDTIIAVRI
jgi:hypothetical protein